MPGTCYIHAGTHKTGTKYLQTFLTLNQAVLANAGLYVPHAGRMSPLSGHHNLVWQLNGDARFDPLLGGLSELTQELASQDAPHVCLSSEDFEYLYKEPDALRRLSVELEKLNYTVKAIFFLRPQVDYGESLYATLLNFGLAMGFDEFWAAFISTGEFDFLERWHFTSDYVRLLDPWARVLGQQNVIVRRYRQGRAPDLLSDFMPLVLPGWKLGSDEYQVSYQNEHLTPPSAQLLDIFVRNNLGASQADETEISRWLEQQAASLPRHFAPLQLGDIVRAGRSLGKANLRLLARYRVFVPAVSNRRLREAFGRSGGPAGSLKRLFRAPPAFSARSPGR